FNVTPADSVRTFLEQERPRLPIHLASDLRLLFAIDQKFEKIPSSLRRDFPAKREAPGTLARNFHPALLVVRDRSAANGMIADKAIVSCDRPGLISAGPPIPHRILHGGAEQRTNSNAKKSLFRVRDRLPVPVGDQPPVAI